jgi:hypothetical protein
MDGYLWSLIDLRAIILGLALLHLMVVEVWVTRWYQAYGESPGNSRPDWLVNVPLLLVVASFLLLIGRWWSSLLAVICSGWVLYDAFFVSWSGLATIHNVPYFSLAPLKLWFDQAYRGQPQQFFQIALAFLILGYILVTLRHWIGNRKAPIRIPTA